MADKLNLNVAVRSLMRDGSSTTRKGELEYVFCEDWFIYAVDEVTGLYYYLNTERWAEWLDVAASENGFHVDAFDEMDMDELIHWMDTVEQAPNAVEKYMLPIARQDWESMCWVLIDKEGQEFCKRDYSTN